MKALPIDFYNMTLNRDCATKTLNTAASDSDHVPCVLRFVCVMDMQGGKPGAHFSREQACPTITKGRSSVNDIHLVCRMRKSEVSDDHERNHL